MRQGGRRRGRGSRICVVAALLATWACSTPPHPPRIVPLSGEPEAESGAEVARWTVEFSAQLREVHVYAERECVFLDAEVGQRSPPVRRLMCVDALSGQTRWTREVPVERRERGIWILKAALVIRDGGSWRAFRRADGEPAWTFEDAAGRPAYDAFEVGEELAINVGNEELVGVEASSGRAVSWLRLSGAQVVDVMEEPMPLAVLLRVTPGEPATAALEGVSIERGEVLWRVPIERWEEPVYRVGPALIGSFAAGELWALAPQTGEVYWKLKRSQLGEEIVYSERRLIVAEAGVDPTMRGVEGHVLRLRGIDPLHGLDRERIWTFEVPTEYGLLGVEGEGGEASLLFGASYDRFFVFDEGRGELVWSYHVADQAAQGLWSTATSNGEAVFAWFDRQGEGPNLLQRIPIVIE